MFKKNVAVIGLGYVGLPLALTAASAGHNVVGVDIDQHLVSGLNNLNFTNENFEYLREKLTQSTSANKFFATNNFGQIKDSEIVVVCLPTPLDLEGNPDLRILIEGLCSVASHVNDGTLVVVESTVYPGTMEQIVEPIFAKNNIKLGYSPERIDPNNKVFQLENTPKIISANEKLALDEMNSFYGSFIESIFPVDKISTAEYAKVIENTYRLVNISLVNELLKIGNALKLDTRSALEAAATKPFGFQLFSPGPGAGGHCVPVDPVYLLWKANAENVNDTELLSAAIKVNHSMPVYVADKAMSLLNSKSSKILILGMAYKSGVADLRESPSLIVKELLSKCGHEVFWFDPLINEFNGETRVTSHENFDLVIVMNYENSYDFGKIQNQNSKILDCTGKLSKSPETFYL